MENNNSSNDEIINEMNKFLKGIYMGITTFSNYYEKAHAMPLKKDIQSIIDCFKHHEEAVIRKIQELGGTPTDSIGIVGAMGEFMEKIKLIPADKDNEVAEHAVKAIEMGIKNSKKFLQEHDYFSSDLKDTVNGVIKDYDNNLRKMQEWVQI